MEEQLDKLTEDIQGAVHYLAVALDHFSTATYASEGTEYKQAVDHYYRIVKQALEEVNEHFVREGLL